MLYSVSDTILADKDDKLIEIILSNTLLLFPWHCDLCQIHATIDWFPCGEKGGTLESWSISSVQEKAASAELARLKKQPYRQHDRHEGLLGGAAAAAAVASHGSKVAVKNWLASQNCKVEDAELMQSQYQYPGLSSVGWLVSVL